MSGQVACVNGCGRRDAAERHLTGYPGFPRCRRTARWQRSQRMEAEERLCRLEQTQGREVRCPENKCAFWEPGNDAVEGWCVLHEVDFAHEPGLAPWLLEIRKAVEDGVEK